MGERKVLNKYYPPDFDSEKLAAKARQIKKMEGRREKRKGPKQMNVRFMMPFTMCCGKCNEFNYVGKKFNSRVEKVQGEDYLGIPVWRFYGKCPSCNNEFSFKTDPKNTAYLLEYGGTRTYDPYRDASLADDSLKEKIRKDMEGDAMKSLEHKTYTAQNELLDLEQLDELRRMNKRLLNRTDMTDEALLLAIGTNEPTEEESAAAKLAEVEDEAEVQQFLAEQKRFRPAAVAAARPTEQNVSVYSGSAPVAKRLRREVASSSDSDDDSSSSGSSSDPETRKRPAGSVTDESESEEESSAAVKEKKGPAGPISAMEELEEDEEAADAEPGG